MIDIHPDLFTHEYPRLIETLRRIVTRAESSERAHISSLILFGSVARLTPHLNSDTDVLVLFTRVSDRAEWNSNITATLRIIRGAEDETMDENYRWHIVPIPADAHASDLDPDFLENVARDSVLLYQRDGYTRPAPLQSLEPFADWQARVRRLLATLTPAT
ncbi:MAG: nucleotidyltransferase family protein [Ktedonobacterales bacterium]